MTKTACPLSKRFNISSRVNMPLSGQLHYDMHHHKMFDADILFTLGASPTSEMLKCAVETKKTQWVKVFIQHGAKPTSEMLDIAAQNKDLKTAKALVEGGAVPSDRLMCNAMYDLTLEWLELLIKARGTPPTRLLRATIADGQSETARYLLTRGAVPDEEVMQLARDKGYDRKETVVWALLEWAYNDHQEKLAAQAAKEVVLRKPAQITRRKLILKA